MSAELTQTSTATAAPATEAPTRAPVRRPVRSPHRHHHRGVHRPAFQAGAPTPVIRQIGTPRFARRIGALLIAVLIATPLLLIAVPWRQAVSGDGTIVGFHPLDREFRVESPIYGRVTEFFVSEGDRVKAGDKIAEVEDVDPLYIETLEMQLEQVEEQRDMMDQVVQLSETALRNVQDALEDAINSADADVRYAQQRVEEYRQKQEEMEAEYDIAMWNYERWQQAYRIGTIAGEKLREYERKFRTSQEKLDAAKAAVAQAEADLESYQAKREKVEAEMNEKVQKALADVQKAEKESNDMEVKINELEPKIRRQKEGQVLKSPRDGTVVRIMTNIGPGAQVKDGDPLAWIVPDTADLAAEIYLSGRDISLVHPGDPVRLQFENWPAVQFVGWPSVAVGTFPARVAIVDATDSKAGKFRILAVPDMTGPEFKVDSIEGDLKIGSKVIGAESGATGIVDGIRLIDGIERNRKETWVTLREITGEFQADETISDRRGATATIRSPWPSREYAKQGVRTKGWVLLREVPLGFELWRRLNGFPPGLAEDESSGKDGYSGDKDAAGVKDDKPKVKRPK